MTIQWLKSTALWLIVSCGLLGCTQTVILFKPKPNIDPMPKAEACPHADEEDPKAKDQWSLAQLGITPDVIQGSSLIGNANVRIAILSTGIDYNHEDLCGQVEINRKEISQKAIGDKVGVNQADDDGNGLVDDVVGYDVVDGDGFAYDRHGAGTAVAGIIAANQRNGIGIAGLMKNVTLIPIRYIDNNGQSSVGSLTAALSSALKLKPHVIFLQTAQLQLGGHDQNSELIGDEMKLLKGFLDQVKSSNITIVVGAGDDMSQFGAGEMDKLLRAYDNILIVTAVDKDGRRTLLANSHGQDVVVAAPGEDVLTLKPSNKYGEVHGTAYAAAHVTAAVGLARAQLADKLDVTKISNVLVSSRGAVADAGLERDTRGGTRLHIVKFLQELRNL